MNLSGGRKALWLATMIVIILSVPTIRTVLADQQPIASTQNVQLFVGDSLVIKSDQNSIQRVYLQGNLTAANYTKPAQYPTSEFALSAYSPGTYDLKVLFDGQTDYKVSLYVQSSNQSNALDSKVAYPFDSRISLNIQNIGQSTPTNSTSYYLSGGPSELDVEAVFTPRPYNTPVSVSSESPWVSFTGWVGKFGEAFPLWVKVLYFALGLQFFVVGAIWIRRETTKRESSPQRLDIGDKAFLWLDVAYKFLLASFVALVLIMGGELLMLFILRFMFLVSLNLLSLWDLFVLGFALGAVIIVYLIRFTFERFLDMKPMENE